MKKIFSHVAARKPIRLKTWKIFLFSAHFHEVNFLRMFSLRDISCYLFLTSWPSIICRNDKQLALVNGNFFIGKACKYQSGRFTWPEGSSFRTIIIIFITVSSRQSRFSISPELAPKGWEVRNIFQFIMIR